MNDDSTNDKVPPTTQVYESKLSSNDFPKLGVKISVFEDFINTCGGESVLTNLTTTEVCEKFLKPITSGSQLSYCEFLLRQQQNNNNSFVGTAPAHVFISHAWAFNFLDVVESLRDHFFNSPDIIIWFDLFSNNQHKATNLDFHWWCGTFKSAISDFGHVVMVLSPWHNPIPFTRAWCLFELYCSAVTKSKFEIAMSREQQCLFMNDITIDAKREINRMLAVVDCKNSECFFPRDKERIFEVVQSEIGFNKINSMVFEQLREWMIKIAESSILALEKDNNNNDELKKLKFQNALGELLSSQGKYDEAEEHLSSCLNRRTLLLGAENSETLITMSNLADLYSRKAKYAQAEALYISCLEMRKISQKGLDNIDTLTSLHNLAILYANQHNYDKAEPLYELCLQKRITLLGGDHVDTLSSMNDLAVLYANQNKLAKAEVYYKSCLERRTSTIGIGADHPDTLNTINHLAVLYNNQARYSEATSLYTLCLNRRVVTLGNDHPDTLTTMHNLAALYANVNRRVDAEPLYQSCLQGRMMVLGASHPDTLATAANLSEVRYALEKSEESQSSSSSLSKSLSPRASEEQVMSMTNRMVTLESSDDCSFPKFKKSKINNSPNIRNVQFVTDSSPGIEEGGQEGGEEESTTGATSSSSSTGGSGGSYWPRLVQSLALGKRTVTVERGSEYHRFSKK